MAVKAHEIFQGDDWFTYRPTVAQAFDTLDRLRSLCEEGATELSALPHDIHGKPIDIAQESIVLVTGALLNLCDDLDGEIEAVLAELSPYLRSDAAHRWMGFEMQMHLKALRTLMQDEATRDIAHHSAIPVIMDKASVTAERIAFILKMIDQ